MWISPTATSSVCSEWYPAKQWIFISHIKQPIYLHITSYLLYNPLFPWPTSPGTTATPFCPCLTGLSRNTGCTLSERSAKKVRHYPSVWSVRPGACPLKTCGVTGWSINHHRQKNRRAGQTLLISLRREEKRRESIAFYVSPNLSTHHHHEHRVNMFFTKHAQAPKIYTQW